MMERTGSSFCEKGAWKLWVSMAVVVFFFFFVAVVWMIFIQNNSQHLVDKIMPNSVFLVIFTTLAVLLWKFFRKAAEAEDKWHEYYRKIKLEEFQHALYSEEGTQKCTYDAIKELINKLEGKELKKDHPLYEEIEKMKSAIEEWKKQKDKQLIVEITNSSKTSKTK